MYIITLVYCPREYANGDVVGFTVYSFCLLKCLQNDRKYVYTNDICTEKTIALS